MKSEKARMIRLGLAATGWAVALFGASIMLFESPEIRPVWVWLSGLAVGATTTSLLVFIFTDVAHDLDA